MQCGSVVCWRRRSESGRGSGAQALDKAEWQLTVGGSRTITAEQE
jgi:hypothetical protein